MKNIKAVFCLLAITLFGATLQPSARADTWSKKTVVTFSQAVEVPGKILPAGTYTFQLLDSPSDRHIVQIFNADGSQIIATILAINDYRLKPTGETSRRPRARSPSVWRARSTLSWSGMLVAASSRKGRGIPTRGILLCAGGLGGTDRDPEPPSSRLDRRSNGRSRSTRALSMH